jgi:S1-C subfamily serine protease
MKRLSPWFLLIAILFSTSLACQISGSQPTTTRMPTPVTIILTPPVDTILPNEPLDFEYQDSLLTTLYEQVNPGIVSIQVLGQLGPSLGSGFVYDKQGRVITNYHVVEGADDVEISFPSGLKVRGRVIGTDLDSDLAVIQTEAPENALFPLQMGNSDLLKVGQTVVAIGNPFGLSGTMTVGIISARGRTLSSIRQTPEGLPFSAGGIIQTDAAINPGNSGGPLINLRGEVVGINRAIRTNSVTQGGEPANSGIGFVIPVNIVKRVVPALIENGSYDYPYLGISSREEISLIEQEALRLPQASGAYVLDVVPGGPADQAGLVGGSRQSDIPNLRAGGDLIIAGDGRPVRVFGDLLAYLMENKSPGDTLVLTIIRDQEEKEVTVTLGKRP